MALAALAGCGPPPARVVSNPDPSGKIPAIKDAVRAKDRAALAQMVKDLESEDPAVRFYASQGLERMTKQTLGYRYFDDEERRAPAVRAWQEWLARQP